MNIKQRENKGSTRRKRAANKEKKMVLGTWEEFKIDVSDSDTPDSNGVAHPGHEELSLRDIMPESGFIFQDTDQVMSKLRLDDRIKEAITQAGVAFNHSNVAPLLVAVFEMAAVSVYVVYADDDDDYKALLRVIKVCKIATEWARKLKTDLITELLLSIRAARRLYLDITGFDGTEPGSWAHTLGTAVDKFDAAVWHRGWGMSPEVLAFNATDENDEDE